MVKLSEVVKKYEEEVKKEVMKGVEEVEILIFDVGFSGTGTVLDLYTINDVYTYPVDEKAENIVKLITEGKIAKIKGKRLRGRKRIIEIESMEEVDPDTVEVPDENIVEGWIERYKYGYRLVTMYGDRYYLSDGTENYQRVEKLYQMGWVHRVFLLYCLSEKKRGTTGEVVVLRGIYLISPQGDLSMLEKTKNNSVKLSSLKGEVEKVGEEKGEDKIKTDVF